MPAFRDTTGVIHQVDDDQADAFRRSARYTEVTGNAADVPKPKGRKASQAKDDGASSD